MVQLAGDGPAVLNHQDGVDAIGEEIQTVCKQFFNSSTHSLSMLTSEMLTQFLEKKGIVNYEGINRLKITEN